MKKNNQSDSKNLVIIVLLVLVVLMSVGFALFSAALPISGSGTLSGNWNVNFKSDSLTEVGKSSGTTVNTASIDAGKLSATLDVSFTKPGDYVEYNIIVENTGDIDAYLKSVNLVKKNGQATNSNAIKFTYTIYNNDKTTTYTSAHMIGESTEVIDTTLTPASATLNKKTDTNIVNIRMDYLSDTTSITNGESGAYTLTLNYEQTAV